MLCIEWYSHSNNFLPSEFVIWSKRTMSTSKWRDQLRRTSYRACKGFTSEIHAGTEDSDWMFILNDKCIQPCLLFRMKYEIQETTWTSIMTCTILIEYVLFCAIKNKTFILQFITTLKQGVILVKFYYITWCLLMIFVCSVQVYVGCKDH